MRAKQKILIITGIAIAIVIWLYTDSFGIVL